MAKKGENRVLVTLSCSECKTPNYRVSKNVKNTEEKLELNKFCSKCRKTVSSSSNKNWRWKFLYIAVRSDLDDKC